MKIALLTAGGIAPCLSSAIGGLIKGYATQYPDAEMIGYLHGYRGLLLGNSITISEDVKQNAEILFEFGGSPIGNSRVKLTNVENCVKMGYVKAGENPLQVAAEQLIKDEITILHTIGGDDTNTTAADLVDYLSNNNYNLTVVGLPKTVDNDVYPIQQTLGAWTAAEQGAVFFENVANESTTSTRQLIIHEIMGRNCGWLTAGTAFEYRERLKERRFLPDLLVSQDRWDVHAVYIPEVDIDIQSEVIRLRKVMDEKDCVNIFLSEGAGIDSIVAEMEANGEDVRRDAFGHVRLDEINPGQWFAKRFGQEIGAEKVLVQKSGYFGRSAASNKKDLNLILKTGNLAIEMAIAGNSGVIGLDEDNGNELSCINFERIKGEKPFDYSQAWFKNMLNEIGQTI
ncbi:MAG: pyrophosphate--fructose-6-phosphate 1-phosphotransferase [Candidatus Marinimicrobia bacterium]|nr:pyrophosphate--fructose-6-phosphate 1-phosphotransferase [Candidatus Neomarinimicrobiota bacterium]